MPGATGWHQRVGRTLGQFGFFWEVFKISFGTIWAHKLRSVLTLLGIIIGVASVVVVGASIEGLRVYVTENISKALGANVFRIAKIARTGNLSQEEWEKLNRTHRNVYFDDMEAVDKMCLDCKDVGARLGRRADVKYLSKEFLSANVVGATASIGAIQNIELAEGRFLTDYEVQHAKFVCVIGSDIKDQLFPNLSALGKKIKLRGLDFEVIGLEERKGSFMGQPQDTLFYIPITTFEKVYGTRRNLAVIVKADGEKKLESAQEQSHVAMRAHRKLGPGREDTFDIQSVQDINNQVGQFTGAIAMVVTPITLISLVVGGIVIMNIMLVSVTERTKEIGLRKSVGARRRDILLQFVIESVLLSSLGGVFGLGLAYGVSAIIMATTPVPMSISVGYILLALVVSGVIGLIFGIYPAYRAAKLDPIVALSKE
jgi:putative ABC transport system permease protein